MASAENLNELAECPVVDLKEVTDESLKKNINLVIQHFKTKYNENPTKVIKVPGRVNLIGEHIDYCGFPVCPMALDKALYIAVAPSSSSTFLQASNFDDKYPFSVIKEYKEKLDISLEQYGWISYIACGIQGVIDKNKELKEFTTPKNMLMAVYGDLPPSAGLSSSSALVCAAFLATCVINDVHLPKTEMATLCAQCEQYIGTCGGGMDQAIAFNGQKGYAKMVKFNPLRLKDIVLPSESVVIIANSLAQKHKATSNDFNTRVVECRIAGFMIGKLSGSKDWRKLRRLSEVKAALDHSSLSEMLILVQKMFHNEPYNKEEICSLLEIAEEELKDLALTPNTYDVDSFKLKQRATHVYSEADRVYTFRNWCEGKKGLVDLGGLMNKSHYSLQQMYECSHPDLDKLVSIFQSSGAYGARLTGAGWGGCTVALITEDQIPTIKKNLYDMYYCNIFKNPEEMESAVFVVQAGDGATIFNP